MSQPTRAHDLATALHLFPLYAVAVAAPLLSVLADAPEFLVSRGVERFGLLMLLGVLCIDLPLVLASLDYGLLRLAPRWGNRFHLTLVGTAVCLVVLLTLKRPLAAMPWLLPCLAVPIGIAATVAYARSRAVRTTMTWIIPVGLAAPVAFVLQPTIASLFFPSSLPQVAAKAGPGAPKRVVMVILDELPLTSLVDAGGHIDATRYPAFAELAATSTWYRDATTVGNVTVYAVPAILTGRYPIPERLGTPTWQDKPLNLFTLLAPSYRMNVHESITHLEAGRAERATSSPGELAHDLALVYARNVLPQNLARRLPRVAEPYEASGEHGGTPPSTAETSMEEFARSVAATPAPGFSFLHIVLPHGDQMGWHYLPNGQSYWPARAFGTGIDWGPEAWRVQHMLQRHLLQVGYADTLLGQLMRSMKDDGTWDQALFILVSDHGVGFEAGAEKRKVVGRFAADTLRVPLFVKRPGQHEGKVDDRFAETIDILPTIASILGMGIPWSVDGESLDGPPTARTIRHVQVETRIEDFDPHALGWGGLEKRIGLLGAGFGFDSPRFWAIGPESDLIGQRVTRGQGASPLVVQLQQPAAYDDVQPEGSFIPICVQAVIENATEDPPPMAVAVNGRIEAVGVPVRNPAGGYTLSVLVPPRCLRKGANDVRIYVVDRRSGTRLLLAPS